MPVPPEVLFHRYFQRLKSKEDRELYRGKADLDRLPDEPLPRKLLEDVQLMLNAALAAEDRTVPQHVDHDPFHFDYVDSDDPNALAFCCDGYSFLGVTTALLNVLWESASRVAESADIADTLDMRLPDGNAGDMSVEQRTAVAVFRLQLFFIVLHEYTHVVHGTAPIGADAEFANEVNETGNGSVEKQVREADADGYAAYYMLQNVIAGDERAHILSVIGADGKSESVQDELLLCCFVIAVAAYLLTREPQKLTGDSVYALTHPPQAFRMSLLMNHVRSWCRQNRDALHDWLTAQLFQKLVNQTGMARWGMHGVRVWAEQIAFLKTETGLEYVGRVERELREFVLRGYRNAADVGGW
jgi:hypothetical protein